MRAGNGRVSRIRRTPWFHGSTGFTLIELMVVIIVLGILVGIAVPLYFNSQANSRDKARIADMRTIEVALEAYKSHYDVYPTAVSEVSGWETSDVGDDFLTILTTENYMDKDAIDRGDGRYFYHFYAGGGYGITEPFYVLGVSNMERSGQPHPDSPGWTGPRAWDGEGGGDPSNIDYREWVTGGIL